jgi:hypothetical protein
VRHDAIYHGTRHLALVLRSGKLLPANIEKTGVFLTRSPEIAAYWANMMGREMDQFCGGILILNRASLVRNCRLEPAFFRTVSAAGRTEKNKHSKRKKSD